MKKRIFGLAAATAFAIAAVGAPAAGAPLPKVFVCHSGHDDAITDFRVGGDHPGWQRRCDIRSRGTGHIIEVSGNAWLNGHAGN